MDLLNDKNYYRVGAAPRGNPSSNFACLEFGLSHLQPLFFRGTICGGGSSVFEMFVLEECIPERNLIMREFVLHGREFIWFGTNMELDAV